MKIEHSTLNKLTNELFEYNSVFAKISFDCFKNNFYECTLLPLAKIISFIENNIESKSDQVIFANKLNLNSSDGPSYYMGEHESHRIFFYDRACSFQSYIELYLKSRSIQFSHVKSKLSFNWLKNFVRDNVVLSALIFNSIKNSFKINEKRCLIPVNGTKRALVLVRTHAQLDFISELVLATKKNVTLLVLPSSTSDGSLTKLCQSRFANESHVDVFYENSNFGDIVKSLIKTFYVYSKFYFNRNTKKGTGTLASLSFNRAFCEMTLIGLSTSLYSKSLGDFLRHNAYLYDILFTCEQKSPQAYIDSYRAREYKLKSVQLMTCDQADDFIPVPVPSDLIIVDTKKTEHMFRTSWRSIVNIEKIKFLGNVKSLRLRRISSDASSLNYDYCYFCHLTEIEQNLKIISILDDHCSIYGKTFCIKLHPRDDKRWLAGVKIAYGCIINNENLKQEEFLSSFGIAISNPSAVVMDLLACCKKFIFINSLRTYQSLPNVYVDEFYPGCLTNLSDLSSLLKRGIDDKEFHALRERILGDNNVEVSFENIMDYLGKFDLPQI